MQTDNNKKYFLDKIALRINNLPQDDPVRVLDCYAGHGILWKAVKYKTGRDIKVLSIEKKTLPNLELYLHGDNLKFLKGMDLAKFDVIDLDSYGCPFDQLDYILSSGVKGRKIFVTFIQSVMGRLPNNLFKKIGITDKMIEKCPTLLCKEGYKKLFSYLESIGIEKINLRQSASGRYNYFCFTN